MLCASPSHHGQVRDSAPAPFQEDLTAQHPLQDTQHVLSAGFPSLLLPSLNLIPKPSSQNPVLYSSCFRRRCLGLPFALLCSAMRCFIPSRGSAGNGEELPRGQRWLCGLGQLRARLPRPGSAFTSSHFLGTGDKQEQTNKRKQRCRLPSERATVITPIGTLCPRVSHQRYNTQSMSYLFNQNSSICELCCISSLSGYVLRGVKAFAVAHLADMPYG